MTACNDLSGQFQELCVRFSVQTPNDSQYDFRGIIRRDQLLMPILIPLGKTRTYLVEVITHHDKDHHPLHDDSVTTNLQPFVTTSLIFF